jgi:hypothetical protein
MLNMNLFTSSAPPLYLGNINLTIDVPVMIAIEKEYRLGYGTNLFTSSAPPLYCGCIDLRLDVSLDLS